MKRFHWSLQRLLDVTGRREQARQAEVLALSRQMARKRQDVLVRRMRVRQLVAELDGLDVAGRLGCHGELMRCTDAHEAEIRRVEGELAGLAEQRKEKTRALMELRTRRETLEKLREQARREHLRAETALEQKQFDESAHVGRTREMIAARRLSPAPAGPDG